MQDVQTLGPPPNQGRMNFPIKGSTWKRRRDAAKISNAKRNPKNWWALGGRMRRGVEPMIERMIAAGRVTVGKEGEWKFGLFKHRCMTNRIESNPTYDVKKRESKP